MIYRVEKSYYGSAIFDIEADSEEEALILGAEREIDLEENLGNVQVSIIEE